MAFIDEVSEEFGRRVLRVVELWFDDSTGGEGRVCDSIEDESGLLIRLSCVGFTEHSLSSMTTG